MKVVNQMAERAYATGYENGWDLGLYAGINGKKQGLKDFGLLSTLESKKANKLMKLSHVPRVFPKFAIFTLEKV